MKVYTQFNKENPETVLVLTDKETTQLYNMLIVCKENYKNKSKMSKLVDKFTSLIGECP